MQSPVVNQVSVRNTRARLLEAAAQRVHDRGFFRTTLDEIASDVSIAKATFYHHFKNKQQLGEALIEYNINRFSQFLREDIFSSSRPGLARLERMCQWTIDQFSGGPLSKGCPVCNLVTELALESPKYRSQLYRYFEESHRLVQTALEDAKQTGDVTFQVEASDLASIFVAMLPGQLLVGKAAIDDQNSKAAGVKIMRDSCTAFFKMIGGNVNLG